MSESRIRSYVLRQARLTRLQQEAFAILSPRYAIPYRSERREFDTEFAQRTGQPASPVILEIGFGMGEATVELAVGNPSVCYLGVEVHKPGVGKVLSEIEAKGLSNLLVIHHDVIPVLECMVARRSLAGAHIFFPDPWPKKKHHKRRLIQPAFSRLLASRIRPGGYIYAATDWEEYGHQMLDVFSATAALRNRFDRFAEDIPWRPSTSFEEKGRRKRHRIYEVYMQKLG
jgi:tRNA (guanine-N7-)-methyltransferase